MPLQPQDVRDAQARLLKMLQDTVATFEELERNADALYGDSAAEVRRAVNECLDDFIRKPVSGALQPETLIYQASPERIERAGLYGAQLALKEHQVTQANRSLRDRLTGGVRQFFRRPFHKWVDVINNFLGSLAGATGLGEALKELKDCLRDELPEDEPSR